jgi:hypothetical protein
LSESPKGRIAQTHLKTKRAGHTLQPTALVNDAYLQLVGQIGINYFVSVRTGTGNRNHFYAGAIQLIVVSWWITRGRDGRRNATVAVLGWI